MPTNRTRTGVLTRSFRRSDAKSGGGRFGRMAVMNWLFKEEPSNYGFDLLMKDKKTIWTGVKNPLAQKHLHAVKRGDRIFYYHTGDERAIVAVATAIGDAYPDPDDPTGRQAVVGVGPVKKLPRPVTLAEIKADKSFSTFPLVRMSRLSVMPVTDDEWDRILTISAGPAAAAKRGKR
jgi:predicted RNA-binding protein with PUA-like domain